MHVHFACACACTDGVISRADAFDALHSNRAVNGDAVQSMPIVALSLAACRFDLKLFNGKAPPPHLTRAQPAVNTDLLRRGLSPQHVPVSTPTLVLSDQTYGYSGSPRVRCLALFDSGDGGGPHPPPNQTAYSDGWRPKGSWQTCWILLVCMSFLLVLHEKVFDSDAAACCVGFHFSWSFMLERCDEAPILGRV